MAQYKTPGVYVKEENAFGSSIVANETAIPVFIGFTEKATLPNGDKLGVVQKGSKVHAPLLIRSMLEYGQSFGGADTTGTIEVTEKETDGKLFYVSEIKKGDDAYAPGLLHPSIANYFANGGGSCYVVSIGKYQDFDSNKADYVKVADIEQAFDLAEKSTLILPTDLIRYKDTNYYDWCNQFIAYCGNSKKQFCVLDVVMKDENPTYNDDAKDSYRKYVTMDPLKYAAAYYPYLKSLTTYAYDLEKVKLNDDALPTDDNAKVEDVKSYLATNYINLPPSPFIAGIYSRLDNASGVWTPPANVAPTGITGPLVNLTHQQQEDFNVDGVSGKSINAIRSFTGKGTLVWGARTNDGNSQDWRYVNVKRLFIAIETDISQALKAYVFKANVHNTWVEVKTMIDSYLFGLFNDGAFAGQTPETSYQVMIGVGETMTDEDVLNGYMRASIRVAPVRPAEFIELTFSQMVGS